MNLKACKGKVIAFDFDGTICNSLDVSVVIFNKLAEKYRFRSIDPQDMTFLRSLSISECLNYLQVKKWMLPWLLFQAHKEFYSFLPAISVYPGMQNVLKLFKESGATLLIVSSNTKKNIFQFLKIHQIENFFDMIYSVRKLEGKHSVLQRIPKMFHLSCEDILYVGDELRDICAADKASLKCVSVTWGANAEKVLKEKNPHIAHTPNDLLFLIPQLFKSYHKHHPGESHQINVE